MSELSCSRPVSLVYNPKTLLKSSCTNGLPTPPSTSREDDKAESIHIRTIVQAFKQHRSGKLSVDDTPKWKRFTLSPNEYEQLERVLQSDESLWGYVHDKVRSDYFPSTQRFVIRMKSYLHEDFIHSVTNDIGRQLERLGEGQSPSARFARSIRRGTSTIEALDPEYGPHTPDCFFKVQRTQIPGVVLEISYSQKRKDLPILADEYILGSNENVRVVIGLDLEYKGKEAALSIWRPVVEVDANGKKFLKVEQVVTNQAFRDTEGHVVDSGGLNIPLTDFANSATLAQYQQPLVGEIRIAAFDLYTYLNEAEQEYLGLQQQRFTIAPMAAELQKRKRSESPGEEIDTSEDEARHPHKHVELSDSSFETTTIPSDNGIPSTRVLRSRARKTMSL